MQHCNRYAAIGLHRQRGVASLLISLVVLISMTILTFAVARTGLMEQKLSANEARAKETLEASEAALEYGSAWLATNHITWSSAGNNTEQSTPTGSIPNITVGNFTYTVSVTYQRDTTTVDTRKYILIKATATASNDSSITNNLSQYAYQIKVLNDTNGNKPVPMIMNGCLSNVGGTPDIWPEGADPNLNTSGTGISIATSKSQTQGAVDCINNGPSGTNLNLHSTGGPNGDGKQYNVNLDLNADGTGSVWEYIFDIDKTTFVGNANTSLSDAGPLYYITDSGNWGSGNTTYGSANSPVVIFFSSVANCPRPVGGITVYGIIYLEGNCSDANGWGGLTVYGAVLVDGNMNKLNANTDIRYIGLAPGSNGNGLAMSPLGATKIIGTWNDFN